MKGEIKFIIKTRLCRVFLAVVKLWFLLQMRQEITEDFMQKNDICLMLLAVPGFTFFFFFNQTSRVELELLYQKFEFLRKNSDCHFLGFLLTISRWLLQHQASHHEDKADPKAGKKGDFFSSIFLLLFREENLPESIFIHIPSGHIGKKASHMSLHTHK